MFIMILAFSLVFTPYLSNAVVSAKSPHYFSCPCIQNDYCNPRCACAPRVNNYIMCSSSLCSTELEIYFDRSQIEGATVLQNYISLSFRKTQIPFTIEVIHASITDALDESLHNLADFLNTDFTDIVNATPGKISCRVVLIILKFKRHVSETQYMNDQ